MSNEWVIQSLNDLNNFIAMDDKCVSDIRKLLVIDYTSNKSIISNIKQVIAKLPELTTLEVTTIKLNFGDLDSAKEHIKQFQKLSSISVKAKFITSIDLLIERFNFYSCLEKFEINCKKISYGFYEKSKSFSKSKDNIYNDLNKIINNNKIFIELISKIKAKTLCLIDLFPNNNIDKDNCNESQLEFLVGIGKIYYEIEKYEIFRPDNENLLRKFCGNNNLNNVKEFYSISKQWNPFECIFAANKEHQLKAIESLKIIMQYDKDFDINMEHPIYDNKNRLIDFAIYHGLTEVVEFFLKRKNIDLTCLVKLNRIPKFDEKFHENLNRFPLNEAISRSNNNDIIVLLANKEESLYDFIAWKICLNDDSSIKNILQKTNINFDPNQQITDGVFKDFTLYQLAIYYQRTDIFFFLASNIDDISIIANSVYPDAPEFDYANWPLLCCATNLGLADIIEFFFEKEKEDNNSSHNLITTLHLNGIAYEYNSIQILLDGYNSRNFLYQYIKSLEVIIKYRLFLNINNLYELELHDISTNESYPIIHNLILRNAYELIEECIKYFNIYSRSTLKGFANINSLQAAIIFCSSHPDKIQEDAILTLLQKYIDDNKFDFINENIVFQGSYHRYKGYNLLQIAIVKGLRNLVKKLLEIPNDNVNKPYPIDSAFPNWKPIQVVIFLAKKGKISRDIIRDFLHQDNIELNYTYPTGYMQGLNILQASILDVTYDPEIWPYKTNIDDQFIESIVLKTGNKLNIPCNDSSSPHYGLSPLHLAVICQKFEIVKLLLENDFDYMRLDLKGNTAQDIATQKGYINIADLINSFIDDNPKYLHRFESGKSYPSEINIAMKITKQEWVISIVQEYASPHVFLILEGLKGSDAVIFGTHMLASGTPLGYLKTTRKGYIHYDEVEEKIIRKKDFSLLKRLDLKIVQLKPGVKIYSRSAFIKADRAQGFMDAIKEEAAKESKLTYSILGRNSIFAVSFSDDTHNCISWAQDKFNLIVNPEAKIDDDWTSKIVTNAYFYLNKNYAFIYNHKGSNEKEIENLKYELSYLKKRTSSISRNQGWIYGGIVFVSSLAIASYLLKNKGNASLKLGIAILVSSYLGKVTSDKYNSFYNFSEQNKSIL